MVAKWALCSLCVLAALPSWPRRANGETDTSVPGIYMDCPPEIHTGLCCHEPGIESPGSIRRACSDYDTYGDNFVDFDCYTYHMWYARTKHASYITGTDARPMLQPTNVY